MTRFEKTLVWGSSAAVSVTGTVYAIMKHLLQPADPFAIVNHPLQPLVLKLHILSAPVMVFAVGVILMRHIWPHFRNAFSRGRRSGITTAAFTIPMVVTGYALEAISSTPWLRIVGWAHLALGLIYAAACLAHFVATRRGAVKTAAQEHVRKAA